jgi:septal ring factor EnvC (AmiA/AmiB activator)
MRWIVRLAVLAIAFAAVREIQHRREVVVGMGDDLRDQRRAIDDAEAEMDSTDRSTDDAEQRLRELDARITAIEREHPGGVSGSDRPEYERLVAERNDAAAIYNELIGRQRRLHDDYKAQVDRHNERVADANSYAAGIGPCALLPEWLRARVCGEPE